ncbi:riboflavin synthase [Mumia sp. zg.B53]|uniref:riboflavin synthase n=1 Tax=Mumia sp. zg.B53 TaxID=2855449 RepID=UPI001C6F1736|nr:riboflavin synthase [Mumia sp. zg.B53]MBW9216864.1 riboflavin synthase [Mumia sp. zg.B53]
MFTGIVEELGSVAGIEEQDDAIRLTLRGPLVVSDAGHGDSIAVNGCCLTVTDHDADTFTVDVMKESLDKTSLGALALGDPVNLERAMRADGRFGGHVVQGHVDGTGTIASRTASEHWEVVAVAYPRELGRYLVPKGSVTVDGTSLTVVDVGDETFTISLIPTTLAATTLGTKQPGDPVNLEVDVLAKYVERLLASGRATEGEPRS